MLIHTYTFASLVELAIDYDVVLNGPYLISFVYICIKNNVTYHFGQLFLF